ncbi:MAG: hypothetical protein KJN64_07220 [Ignavibacteria bacterium]|nr:hypothetical protein [Ignavibacteria bacterium]MBT8392325.1 hypothetical protein [Ignavibacteria bacterium]NNJ53765.1 hypothetical protein [Ignavibacteriaceae bacterium]NNL19814.1 hypothetical protein [Ignavibacteriaceae bacterium]
MKIIFLIILFPSFLFSQSEFIENDDFGISGGYTFSKNNISNSSTLDFVFTALGVVDIGFQIGSGKLDNEYSSSSYNSSANLVYAAYNVKRRNNNLVLKILAGYYSGSVKSSQSTEFSSSGLLLGLGVYPRIIKVKQLSMRIALELSYGFLSTSSDGGYFRDDSQFDNSRTISLGINWLVDVTKNFHFVVSPFVSKDLMQSENSFYYGINGRLLLSFEAADNTYK